MVPPRSTERQAFYIALHYKDDEGLLHRRDLLSKAELSGAVEGLNRLNRQLCLVELDCNDLPAEEVLEVLRMIQMQIKNAAPALLHHGDRAYFNSMVDSSAGRMQWWDPTDCVVERGNFADVLVQSGVPHATQWEWADRREFPSAQASRLCAGVMAGKVVVAEMACSSPVVSAALLNFLEKERK